MEPFFIQHALNSPFCYFQSQKYTHGVGNQDLGLTRMVNIVLAICNKEEQKAVISEIEKRLSIINNFEEIITENIQKSESLRQSILNKAFEGKLLSEIELETVRRDPEWEPAEELLERIKKH